MTPETTVLLLLPVLGGVYMMAGGGIPRIIEQGWGATFYGPRDDLPAFNSKYAQRMERANENFKETLPYAVGLLVLVQVLGVANETSAMGAWTYFWSRVAYIPIYYTGVPLVRSGIWVVSIVGLVLIALPILALA